MGDIQLDSNEDLLIVDGDLTINDGAEAVRQNILQRLGMFLGEWFLDTEVGVPYYQQILVKNPNLGNVDAIFQNAILGTIGVVSLDEYSSEFDVDTRQFFVTFRATTTQGTVDYSGAVI